MKRLLLVITGWALTAAPILAAEPLDREVLEATRKSVSYFRSISTEGGYLWHYSVDLTDRAG